jgi:II/X family phage/plasmid replication protein
MVSDIYCPWESIASSHSGMALKVYHEGNGACTWPYIEIKCSPAKLLQGHNVFGFDDLRKASKNMLFLLNHKYPEFLAGWEVLDDLGPMLDLDNARVSELDITYSLAIYDETTRFSFIEFCRYLSKGHTKNSSNSYDSTVYFGSKNSRLKRLKVYLKGIEIENDNKNRIKKGLSPAPPEVVELSKNLVRIECTLKKEWLERRGISVKLVELIDFFEADADQYKSLFFQSTLDFFKAFEGQEMTI